MFVDIDNPKAPLGVEVMLFPYKKGKENITPEVCLNVLKSTNYQRGIKDMLNLILELPVKEQASFKDVVLSTFDHREQPNDIIVLGKKLAVSGGYEREMAFMARRIRVGEWLPSHAAAEKWTTCTKKTLENPKGNVSFLSREVDLSRCDLSEVKGLKFVDGAEVDLRYARNLPEDLDVSMCSSVDLGECDLSSVKEIKFRDGAEVDLSHDINIPKDLDVSNCAKVNLGGCDLSSVNDLKFRDGAEVNLSYAKNLPADLDVSMCSDVELSCCDLGLVNDLKFADGAEVTMWSVRNLPANLDVSMCSNVVFGYSDLNEVEKITFKNKQQMEDSCLVVSEDWKGKLVFVDEVEDGRGLNALHYMNKGGRE